MLNFLGGSGEKMGLQTIEKLTRVSGGTLCRHQGDRSKDGGHEKTGVSVVSRQGRSGGGV